MLLSGGCRILVRGVTLVRPRTHTGTAAPATCCCRPARYLPCDCELTVPHACSSLLATDCSLFFGTFRLTRAGLGNGAAHGLGLANGSDANSGHLRAGGLGSRVGLRVCSQRVSIAPTLSLAGPIGTWWLTVSVCCCLARGAVAGLDVSGSSSEL